MRTIYERKRGCVISYRYLVLDEAVDGSSRGTKKTNKTKVTESTTSTLGRITSDISLSKDDTAQDKQSSTTRRDFGILETTD